MVIAKLSSKAGNFVKSGLLFIPSTMRPDFEVCIVVCLVHKGHPADPTCKKSGLSV